MRLRLDHERRDLGAAVGDGVHVGGGAADVDDDEVADVLGEPLGGDEHRAGRRQDLAVDDLADALHARRVRDVLLEGVVDDGAGRHDVELVDARIDVVGELDLEAGPLQQLLRVAADDGVAGVHDDRARLAARRAARR